MIESLVDELDTARRRLLDAAAGLTDLDVRRRPKNDGWSVIEVLAHLSDVDLYYLSEALAIRDESAHRFAYFDDEDWKSAHPRVLTESLPEVQARVDEAQNVALAAVHGMSPATLARTGSHPRGHAYAVEDVLRRFIGHDQAHTDQIQSIRTSLGV